MRYVFDLDGTICTQEKSGEYHLAKPIKKMIDKVNALFDAGHDITIYTARGMVTFEGDLERVMAAYWNLTDHWLHMNGVKYHRLRMGKPPADFYVDDKAVAAHEFLG